MPRWPESPRPIGRFRFGTNVAVRGATSSRGAVIVGVRPPSTDVDELRSRLATSPAHRRPTSALLADGAMPAPVVLPTPARRVARLPACNRDAAGTQDASRSRRVAVAANVA